MHNLCSSETGENDIVNITSMVLGRQNQLNYDISVSPRLSSLRVCVHVIIYIEIKKRLFDAPSGLWHS